MLFEAKYPPTQQIEKSDLTTEKNEILNNDNSSLQTSLASDSLALTASDGETQTKFVTKKTVSTTVGAHAKTPAVLWTEIRGQGPYYTFNSHRFCSSSPKIFDM